MTVQSHPSTAELNFGPVRLAQTEASHGPTTDFEGAVLGRATSHALAHRGHDGTEYAPRTVRCSACRWLEATLYLKRNGDGRSFSYVVHTVGASDVPGEVDFIRITETPSAFEAVELLTVRKGNAEPYIPPQHARILSQAAALDENIRDAYVNRAVI